MRHPINLLLTPLCALCAAGGAWAQPEAEEEGWGEESTEAGWGEDGGFGDLGALPEIESETDTASQPA